MHCPTLAELPEPPRGKKGWPWTEETLQLPDSMPDGRLWPRVSMVTPSYNQGRFIEETIRSVLLQGYPNMEYIIIDGGSTDETLDILKKYSNSLIWISEPDKGQSDAINKGWRISKGEILAYLNSDDTYMPWAVETAVKFLAENPDISMVYGKCNLMDESSGVIGEITGNQFDLKETLLYMRHGVPQPTAFFRREVIEKVGYLDTNLDMAMDLDLWIRISLRFKMKYISKLLANFRICPGTKTESKGYKFEPDHLYILNKTFSNLELPYTAKTLKRPAYSRSYLRAGLSYRSQHQNVKALKSVAKSVQFHPWPLIDTSAKYLLKKAAKRTSNQ